MCPGCKKDVCSISNENLEILYWKFQTLLLGMLNKIKEPGVHSSFSEGRVCEISRMAKCIKLKPPEYVEGNV